MSDFARPGNNGRRFAKVVAVIPNWNGGERLARCIASLNAQRGAEAEILVVDNASTDGSPEAAGRAGARVMRLPKNYGFSRAVNEGIAASDSEFVAVINNDVVLDAGWLPALIAALERHPECGMVTGRTFAGRKGTTSLLDGVGDALSLGFAAARLGRGCRDGPEFESERAVPAVSGAASLFRREVFRRVGGFEEAFFAYLEDVDLCLRSQLAGFQARYIPAAVAWHEGSVSTVPGGYAEGRSELSPQVAEWMTAHQLLLAARYARSGTLRVLLPRILAVQALWAARVIFRGHVLGWLRGLARAATRWGRMQAWRFSEGGSPERLLELLRASEAQIRAGHDPHDTFWKMYFRCFPLR